MSGRRTLRSQLTRRLVGLGLISVVLLAAVNFVVVRTLLDSAVRDQLTTLREVREDAIESGVERLLDRVAVIGADPGMAQALLDLETGYEAFDVELTSSELDDVEDAYAEVVGVYDAAGVDRPEIDELVPSSTGGRSAQLAYVAGNPNPPAERSELVDAGDGSAFSAAHAEHHGYLRGVARSIAANDLLLVSAHNVEVVYSVEKRIDLGTDVETGPYRETGLGGSWQRLEGAAVSDAVIVDASFYLPDSSVPLVQVAATIRQDTEVIGAVVIQISIDNLTNIVTAGQQFDLLGLGDTGDAYVVGADGRYRSVPRGWFEDPDAYIDRYRDNGGDERTAALMEFTGAPVLLHQVDNRAVRAAAGGEEFLGLVRNGLGQRSLTASAPLDVEGLDWILVTEQQTSETRAELEGFLWSTLVLLAVLLPILAIVGAVLARVFARPVGPLVRAAHDIAAGDFDAKLPDLGRNELGDLGLRLGNVAAQLREEDRAVAAEEERINEMLASVLPPALVDRVRRGERDITELVDTATVVALTILGLPELSGAEQDAVLDLTERLATEMDALSLRYGVERIRAAAEQQLFVAGRGHPDAHAPAAVAFAVDAVRGVRAVGAEFGVDLSARAGLSAGLVVSGVVGSRQMSFGMWGVAVDLAVELSEQGDGGVFVDGSVVDLLGDDTTVTAIDSIAADHHLYEVETTGVHVDDAPGTGRTR